MVFSEFSLVCHCSHFYSFCKLFVLFFRNTAKHKLSQCLPSVISPRKPIISTTNYPSLVRWPVYSISLYLVALTIVGIRLKHIDQSTILVQNDFHKRGLEQEAMGASAWGGICRSLSFLLLHFYNDPHSHPPLFLFRSAVFFRTTGFTQADHLCDSKLYSSSFQAD